MKHAMERTNPQYWVGSLLLVLLSACGPGVTQGPAPAGSEMATIYRKQCDLRTSRQRWDTTHEAYNPATLVVEHWPAHAQKTLTELQFVDLLAAGDLKRVALFARGGLGKTRLAESLRAQLCGKMPAFVVDLKQVTGADAEGALQATLVRDAGPDVVGLAAELAEGRLLVLADSIDELDATARQNAMAALNGLSNKFPRVQIVLLARPPVLDTDYGFKAIDARLAIRPLQCQDSDNFIAQTFKTEETRGQFVRFLKRFGLDGQEKDATTCRYPYLASYRDMTTLADFFKKSMEHGTDLIVSRSHAHEALIGARLHKELESLGWTQDRALQLLDHMVAAQLKTVPPDDLRALQFDVPACTAQLEASLSEPQRQAVCEKVFQSALFLPVQGKPAFQLAGSGIAHLFVARWLDQEVTGQKVFNCRNFLKRAELLQHAEIARFLVGQPGALKCLMPILDERCAKQPKSDQIEVLDDGLPIGRPRTAIVATMHQGYEGTHWKMCTQKTLKSLDGTISTP